MPTPDEGDTYVVVFDVNVYLDIAELIGAPFSWAKFDSAVRDMGSPQAAVSSRARNQVASLRAVALSRSGRLVDGSPLQIWTSDHIDGLVVKKACDPVGHPVAEQRGLGWSVDHAEDMHEDLVRDIVEQTGGGTLLATHAEGSPPLSHEDGMVLRTARDAAENDPLIQRVCVTSDYGFRTAALPKYLRHINVLYPREYVEFVNAARRVAVAARMAAMAPRRGNPAVGR